MRVARENNVDSEIQKGMSVTARMYKSLEHSVLNCGFINELERIVTYENIV
jgi:hypothetical protein